MRQESAFSPEAIAPTLPVFACPCCPCCGLPFATEGGIDHPCAACTLHAPPFAAARGALRFEGAARELVHRFKYDRKVHLARPLGILTVQHLTSHVAAHGCQLVVPVPLHVKRLRQRGFNQAILLGELLARHWQLPLVRDNLRRVRWTEPQVGLAAHERAGNVRGTAKQ